MFRHGDVVIRPVETGDLERMVQLRADPRVWTQLGDVRMIGIEDQRDWFERVRRNPSRRYYVLCTDSIPFLGVVRTDEIDHLNRSMRVGGDILPEYWGKGYGTQMFALLEEYCFNVLNMNRLWLLVLDSNVAARRLYAKAGFREEGRMRQALFRNGRYEDYVMMSLLRAEWEQRA